MRAGLLGRDRTGHALLLGYSGGGSAALALIAAHPQRLWSVALLEPVVALSFLTVFPAGEALPLASNLNFRPGQTVPNLVVAKQGAGGRMAIYNAAGTAHVIADVAGWFDAG